MPAQIAIVHDQAEFLKTLAIRLREAGYSTATFQNSMTAYDALTRAEFADVLVTRVQFPPGQPNGVALANAARRRRPMLKVIFMAASPEFASHAAGIGPVFLMPVPADRICQAVQDLLSGPTDSTL